MGHVINRSKALNTPCTCYKLDGELLCWSPGIIGTLTDKQEAIFCTSKDVTPATKELKNRIISWQEALDEAQERYWKEPYPHRAGRWQEIVSEELAERGIEI